MRSEFLLCVEAHIHVPFEYTMAIPFEKDGVFLFYINTHQVSTVQYHSTAYHGNASGTWLLHLYI